MNNINSLIDRVAAISISEYSYHLSDDKIAKYPVGERDQSKLLVWKAGAISDLNFSNLATELPSRSLLVFNNTEVIRARMVFKKSTGARIEIFCLDPFDPSDYQLSFQSTRTCIWKCMVGNQKKWKNGLLTKKFTHNNLEFNLNAELVGSENNVNLIRFSWDNRELDFSRVIELAGALPIPPYLNRETETCDLERYQTVYSKIKGSVAAPTAGLHFTDKIMDSLLLHGHELAELTLHVGAGTFQPVKSEAVSEHQMHTERLLVSRQLLLKLVENIGRIIAVGTTSVRALESLYWLGAQVEKNPSISVDDLKVTQWEAYSDGSGELSARAALSQLVDFMDRNQLARLSASTQIMIAPGYNFKLVEGIITNFHQPQSTLLLLVSAYLGNEWKRIYEHALANNYRFLSYGDSNLYLK